MKDENYVSKEQLATKRSLGWRLATVAMVLGVPLIVMYFWSTMVSTQANEKIQVAEIEATKQVKITELSK